MHGASCAPLGALAVLSLCLSLAGAAPASDLNAPYSPPNTQSTTTTTTPAAPRTATSTSEAQIDQLTAPVALYPDRVLTNVLIASTYPIEVVAAANWVKDNQSLNGDALARAAADKNWDDSILALLNAPVVLAMMSQQIEWTNKLGETFLADQQAVMDSIQRLRKQALATGKLASNDKQTVTTEGGVILILPVEEQVMYVPYYDPTDYYGDWMWADYPPYYWPPPPGYGIGRGFFAAAIIYGIWNGTIDWPGHGINFGDHVEHWNRPGRGGERWQFRPEHRRGMNYTRPELQNRFGGRGNIDRGAIDRGSVSRDFRGFEQGNGAWSDHQRVTPRDSSISGGLDGVGRGRDTRGYSNRGYSSRGGGFGGMRGGGMRGGGMRGGGGRR